MTTFEHAPTRTPVTTLQTEFGMPNASPTSWEQASSLMADATVYWIATTHHTGQPNIVPLFGVWLDDTWYFCTGEREQKAANLRRNPRCTILTGTKLNEGIDVVLQGEARRITDNTLLQRIADEYLRKYAWPYAVRDGAFDNSADGGGIALVFAVAPVKGHGFSKGFAPGQTRWTFEAHTEGTR